MTIQISVKKDGKKEVAIVEVLGQLMSGPDTGELDEALYQILDQGRSCIIDLKDCDWINSSGNCILIHHYKKFHEAGRTLTLCGLTERVNRIMVMSRLSEVFEISNDVDEAFGKIH